MAFAVFLYVSKPVASLQFDLETTGSFTLDPVVQKQVITNRLPDGKLRVLIYGLDRTTFSGKFGRANKSVKSITNIVGADLDGNNANASVSKMSSPEGVVVFVNK